MAIDQRPAAGTLHHIQFPGRERRVSCGALPRKLDVVPADGTIATSDLLLRSGGYFAFAVVGFRILSRDSSVSPQTVDIDTGTCLPLN